MVAQRLAKRLGRHVRMPDDIVRRSKQFLLGETADIHEDVIDEGDAAGGIGAGDQRCVAGNFSFNGGDRLVDSHVAVLLVGTGGSPIQASRFATQQSMPALINC